MRRFFCCKAAVHLLQSGWPSQMQENTTETLQIAYSGPALANGRMPMEALAVGLRGQALLIHRVKDLLYGESVSIRVEIDSGFQAGSLIIPVHILTDGLRAAEGVLTSPAVNALSNLMQILGFFGISGVTLYKLFKRLKGRRIENPEDVPKDIKIDISVEVLIQIYNDPEVQTQLRQTVAPLYEDGIEEFQTRRQGVVIERVSKSDLIAADEAELDALIKDEEITLDIQKAAWRRNLAWHFSDGRTSFDAKIEDDSFWKRIAQGEAFADGDRLRVHLRTTAQRKKHGRLKVQREIPVVLDTEHIKRRQPNLFDDGESE
jgi:hypothetical protein